MEAAHAYYKNEFTPQQFIIGTQHVVIDYSNSQVSITKAANTYDVDAVSGASVSSRAIKAAVKDALSQAKQTVSND
ncbi:hypothetical protein WP50_05280 [Lactiplantibacillus plantarum]|nr:hypothetical protein WP50_05280 [Lactiplantibacillus plantarum]